MNFSQFLGTITTSILQPITVLIIGLAVLYFLLGLLKYIQSVGDETKHKEGITMMTYGIIGIFVMVSLWGLVHVLKSTFTGLNNNPINPPSLGGSSGNPLPSGSYTLPGPAGMGQPF